jgi:glycosyltransferase involved in cell wall biosynthesis
MPLMNQKKLIELSNIPKVSLRAIVPKVWKSPLFTLKAEDKILNAPFSYLSLNTMFAGNEARYFYLSLDLTIREFNPDIVQVEQGLFSLSLLQTLLYRRIWRKTFKVGFFAWVINANATFRLKSSICNYILRNVDFAVCGMEETLQALNKLKFDKPSTHLAQIGIDPAHYHLVDVSDLRNKLGIKLNDFVVGFGSRMVPEKGLLMLIEAVATLDRNVVLLLIGDGPQKNMAINLAKSLKLGDKAIFVNPIPHLEFRNYLNLMNVFVLPSKTTSGWKEQFAQGLLMAMSCQVPVIGSSCGAIPSVIGDAGLIFQEGNTQQLANCIKLIQCDAKLRNTLILKGIERVNKFYTWKRLARIQCEFWEKILNNR